MDYQPSVIERLSTGLPVDMDAVLTSNDAFAVAMATAPDQLTAFMSEKFNLPVEIVRLIAERDKKNWTSANRSGKAIQRNDPLRRKIMARFEVANANMSLMKRLLEAVPVGRKGYLDIGSGMGFTMLAAKALGFEVSHGVEIDPSFHNFAKQLMPDNLDGELGCVLDDFLSHEFTQKYDFITFYDVFEHVADHQKAMEKAASLLTDDGLIYIYQGNQFGPHWVAIEPHYRMPFITLLDRDDAVDVLKRAHRIADEPAYVVQEWPALSFFATPPGDLKTYIHTGERNFKSGHVIDTPEFVADVETWLAPKMADIEKYLTPEIRERLDGKLSAWYAETKALLERGGNDLLLNRQMRTWNLMISRNGLDHPDFRLLSEML